MSQRQIDRGESAQVEQMQLEKEPQLKECWLDKLDTRLGRALTHKGADREIIEVVRAAIVACRRKPVDPRSQPQASAALDRKDKQS